MAQKVHVVLEDDIDGTEAAETLAFSVDGVSYEIDLNSEHAEQLRESFAPWVRAGRRVGGRRSTQKATSKQRNDLAEVRAWAKEQGLQVAERGRVSQDVQDAYRAAHAG